MNDYFDSTQNRIPIGGRAKSAEVNNLRDETGLGFDMLPSPSKINQGSVTFAEDTGTANQYAVALSSTITTYDLYLTVGFIPSASNTGASTLNVNGLGAIAIKDNAGNDLVAGTLTTTGTSSMTYNGTHFILAGVSSVALGTLVGEAEDARDEAVVAKDAAVVAQTAAALSEANIDTAISDSSIGVLQDCNTDNDNIFVGVGSPNISGNKNIAVGLGALAVAGNAFNNTAIGDSAGASLSSGRFSVFVGTSAGYSSTTGDSNTLVGNSAGVAVTTGERNLLLGAYSGQASSPSGHITTQDNIICLGDNNITALYCAETTISSSDGRDKADVEDLDAGLDFINALRPVTYRWDKRAFYEDGIPDGTRKRDKLQVGLIAQELESVESTHDITNLVSHWNEDNSSIGKV